MFYRRFNGLPVAAKSEDIHPIIIAGRFFGCQCPCPLHTACLLCPFAPVTVFGIAGGLFVLGVTPIIPTGRTYMLSHITSDKDCCRIGTPRTAQINLIHPFGSRQLAISENIPHRYIGRCRSSCNVGVAFTMDDAIFEQSRRRAENKVGRPFDCLRDDNLQTPGGLPPYGALQPVRFAPHCSR